MRSDLISSFRVAGAAVLEPAILQLEQAEQRAGGAALTPIQQDLFTLRKRYKTLAC